MAVYNFLKEETFGLRKQVTFSGNKCEMYIPAYFIDKSNPNPIAEELGDRVKSIGLFWFRVDGRDWYELQFPLKFQFQYSEKSKASIRIKPEMPQEDYIVYTLHNNDAFVYDKLHKKDLDDLKLDFIGKILENAKMPKTIKYNDSFNIFINAMSASETNSLGISSVSIELLLSEMYRNKKNLHEPFRLAYNGKNDYDYRLVRIVKLPGLNSTFTSIIGEDINNQLVSSILRKREGIADRPSPIEEIIKS